MGLLDVLKGMQNGPHGQPQPSKPGSAKSGGMSPLMMALLGAARLQGRQRQRQQPSERGAGRDRQGFLAS